MNICVYIYIYMCVYIYVYKYKVQLFKNQDNISKRSLAIFCIQPFDKRTICTEKKRRKVKSHRLVFFCFFFVFV
jgi:hypothetical protein